MKVLIITSSPNTAGLTASCGKAARQGVVDSHNPARVVDLNELKLNRCAVCNDGWGTCLSKHHCQMQDDFQALHTAIGEAEGYVFVTPVYYGEPSEPMKALFDRLRRCEATKDPAAKETSVLNEKPAVCIAAAGESGHGTVDCLAAMERVLSRLGVDRFDFIPVTSRTRDYQLETIHDALSAMTAVKPIIHEKSSRRRKERRTPRKRRRR
ncbi:MAG: flavodoxin family protein [Candidatus Bipolaricaulota bacterium]|nr:flavodoxin family protein [Candidatus Bipolaricaulota bacterium]